MDNKLSIQLESTFLMKTLLFFLIFTTLINNLPANGDPTHFPQASWQALPNNISVAANLCSSIGGKDRMQVTIYVKNTGTAHKYIQQASSDGGIEIYYKDTSGHTFPLHDYRKTNSEVILGNIPPALIASSQIFERSIKLNPKELDKVRGNPVFFRFYISNTEVDGYASVETSPAVLAEAK